MQNKQQQQQKKCHIICHQRNHCTHKDFLTKTNVDFYTSKK